MENKRILYIDLMKGLSITWVVWFHTTHPSFVDYGFRMPLFFLASAIFFKAYPVLEFAKRKIYQLIIPFIVFYLAYYLFMIFSNALSKGNFGAFDYSCVFDVLRPYNGNGGPTVNPPLWFIMALLDLQIMLYIFSKCIKNKFVLLVFSFVISLVASVYLFETYTYFQFGRALRYFSYYAFGFLYGKEIIKNIESNRKNSIIILALATTVFITAIICKQFINVAHSHTIIDYFQITALVVLLIYFFKFAQDWFIMKPLKYYGANSYIVLGCNEVILSSLLIIFQHTFGSMTILTGFFHWILTMILLIPVIKILNRYIPWLVGKQNPFVKFHLIKM